MVAIVADPAVIVVTAVTVDIRHGSAGGALGRVDPWVHGAVDHRRKRRQRELTPLDALVGPERGVLLLTRLLEANADRVARAAQLGSISALQLCLMRRGDREVDLPAIDVLDGVRRFELNQSPHLLLQRVNGHGTGWCHKYIISYFYKFVKCILLRLDIL